jgi:hypothetical protein
MFGSLDEAVNATDAAIRVATATLPARGAGTINYSGFCATSALALN